MINFAGRRNRANPGCSGCLVPFIGLIFLVVGIYLVKDTLNFLPGTITAQGTITHCSYDDSSDDGHSCAPTVQFNAQSGQSITIYSSESSSSYYEGKTVQVRYHVKTPRDGRIYSLMGTWLLPLVCIGAGLFVLLISLFWILRWLIRALFAFLLLRGIIGNNRSMPPR